MKMIILFSDNPQADPEIRNTHMPDHLTFLEKNSAAIFAAGPFVEADGTVRGGLWLVEVADRRAATALIEADPFFPTGLRQDWEIREWRQVFAYGQRRV